MPRDGSNVYTQPFPNVVDGTTIESAVYNGFTNDVALDLNTPRPIVAGGTGANNAADAAANLGVVTGKAAMTYTEAEKTQARANIAAAPLDALAYSGIQVNGSFEVSQQIVIGTGGIALSNTGAYFCDGWVHLKSTGSAAGTVQAATALAGGAYFPANSNYALVNIATPQGSFSGGDQFWVGQYLEGYRIKRLGFGTANAQSLTLGFWTAHSQTGTFTGTIRNYNGTRSCAFSYTQSAANVGEYKTVTIPGCTDGTWSIDHTAAMIVTFSVAAGATMIAPSSGVWHAANYTAGPGQVNGASTAGNFRITGVVVLPGIEAPSAARSPLIMRPYDQELVTCPEVLRADYFFAPRTIV